MNKPFFIFLLLNLIPPLSSATETNGIWTGFFSKASVTQTVSLWQEFQIRHNTESGTTPQSLFRFGPIWQFHPSQEAGLIYGFVRTGTLTEHRLTQQYSVKVNSMFSARFRLEQRFAEKINGTNLRLRSQVRFLFPLTHHQSFNLWNESFMFLNHPHWVYDTFFDRNRFFIGIKTTFDRFSLEYGYMNQYTNRAGPDLSEHLAIIYLNY